MRPWILAETNYGYLREHPCEVAVLPMGATEPHNLHLPYGTDIFEAETIAGRACEAAFSRGNVTAQVRRTVHEVFDSFESGSIQEVIYKMGTKMLADIPAIAEVRLEANNRTWDTIVEEGEAIGVYTEARPPYGCLGLTLTR